MEDDGTLSIGTRLGEFEIRGLVGIGGFGIVYRAFDHDLEREVAIKEYMPGLLASRTVDGQVQARGRTHAETFEAGRRSFMLEAKMLARFDHPALVKVFRFWEGNGTAYMVMPLYTGQTLAQVLKQMPAPPTEIWLMGVLVPLLGALEALHSQQIFHRDVSPDNILLLRNGRPVLLDFGAARQVISDRTQTLTAILKPNYAPIEQYAEVPNLRQGPWTDLYALGAVVYASLTGKPPTPAAARTVQDDLVPLAEVAARIEAEHGQRYSAAFLDAWQQALAVRPNDRPQSVRELLQRLGLMPSAIAADDDATVIAPLTRAPARLPDNDHTVVVTGLPAHTVAPPPRTGLSTTTSVPTGRDMRMVPPVTQDTTHRTARASTLPPQPPPPTEASAPSASAPTDALAPLEKPATASHGLMAVALAAILGIGVLGYLMTRQPSGPATGSAPAPSAALAASAALASASSTDTVSAASRPAMVIIDEAPERPVASASAPSDLLVAASAPAPVASAPDKAALAAAKASAAAAKASAAAARLAARQAASQATANGALSNLPPTGAGPAPATPHAQVATPTAAPSQAPARTLDDLCGKRNFLVRDLCIQDACLTPEFSRTAACVDLRRKAEDERIRKLHTDG
ncbi:serine/threonine-protein kinase [uncultured Sphaerotilus sp.]|uniref:serine/threonine protein kinase n=1 Tax=uncultured Sphaerotilus sp. TaxID=474984 RepID=UPI0030CA2C0A